MKTIRKTAQSGRSGDLTLMHITQRFSTDETARAYFESIRWPNGPCCVHCGNADSTRIYSVTPNADKKIRKGLYKCAECREGFTVTMGTVMEDSHIPLDKWLIAFYVMCASKTQVSALQLQRQLKLGSYRTALHMCHRIRFALGDVEPVDKLPGAVEADETYLGSKGCGFVKNKPPVVSLIERGDCVHSQAVDSVSGKEITKILKKHISVSAHLNTDESPIYTAVGKSFASHDTVNHRTEEYARKDKSGRLATTNAAAGLFCNSRRSVDGTNHHISRKHTNLYFAELDHKYNTRKVTDGARTVVVIESVGGKC